MGYSSEQIKAIAKKREAKRSTKKVYYKTRTINGNLLKVIGIIALVSPIAYFFTMAVIYFVNM